MSQFILPSLYETILENMPIVCVDVVIKNIDTDKYLLVKRGEEPAKGQWWVVGGRLHKMERPYSCATRKMKEEVGIESCEYFQYMGVESTCFATGYHNIPVHSVNLIYLVKVKGKQKIELNKTCLDYKWVDIKKPLRRIHPYVNTCLSMAFCQ